MAGAVEAAAIRLVEDRGEHGELKELAAVDSSSHTGTHLSCSGRYSPAQRRRTAQRRLQQVQLRQDGDMLYAVGHTP